MERELTLSKEAAVERLYKLSDILLKRKLSSKEMETVANINNLILLLVKHPTTTVCFHCFASEVITESDGTIHLYFPSGDLYWERFVKM